MLHWMVAVQNLEVHVEEPRTAGQHAVRLALWQHDPVSRSPLRPSLPAEKSLLVKRVLRIRMLEAVDNFEIGKAVGARSMRHDARALVQCGHGVDYVDGDGVHFGLLEGEVREQHARVLNVPLVRMAEHEPVAVEWPKFAREKARCGGTRRLIVDRADAGVVLELVSAVGV